MPEACCSAALPIILPFRLNYKTNVKGEITPDSPLPDKPLTPKNSTVEKKPVFHVKDIRAAEKCDCGRLAVSKEIVTPQSDVLRRCGPCYESLRLKFAGADWKQSYAEMPSFEDRDDGPGGAED